jgi:dTDP-4-amino-4,6-dideoxygalactose transaminase
VTEYSIPFNRPSLVGREFEYVHQALAGGSFSGDGLFTERCRIFLEREMGVKRVLLTTSCTHALEMAALLLGLEKGDEVVVPSFTFVSTANAFALHGARPVFCDIRRDTFNIDENHFRTLVSPTVKAVVPVHYGGVASEMEEVASISSSAGIAVVEDNAHGLFGKYRSRYLGTLGSLAAVSFHETKNFSCGEGGALLINDESLIERAEIIREKGTNRARFLRGQVDKYTWVDVGSSYLPSDILAAFLFAQLEARESIMTRRRSLWERYLELLRGWADGHDVGFPRIPDHCEHTGHVFSMLLPTEESRDAFIAHMRRRNILCVFHYLPLHLSPMGKKLGGREGDCPVAEEVSSRIVRLPLYNSMSEKEQERVVECVREFAP